MTTPTKSSGTWARFKARRSLRLLARYSFDEVATWVSLSVKPGATALTTILSSPTSRASARVSPTTPIFEVV